MEDTQTYRACAERALRGAEAAGEVANEPQDQIVECGLSAIAHAILAHLEKRRVVSTWTERQERGGFMETTYLAMRDDGMCFYWNRSEERWDTAQNWPTSPVLGC